MQKKNITLEKFLEKIKIPHKLFKQTILDDDRSLCSGLLTELLSLTFDNNKTVYQFIDKFLDRELSSQRLVIQQTTRYVKKV